MKTLMELYKEHQGKVSDKWELYLREYDRLFTPYRTQPVTFLEIGIQNGGSLEIWGKYFPHATNIIGCDINPDCQNLQYDDPRIQVVVGDASEVQTAEKIFSKSETFDLIIDDGSHKSSDIIKTFAKYFPKLREGGLFIVEDLHCSYWESFEGGLFHPYSSISFFKALVDVVNNEHWGVNLSCEELLKTFKETYQLDFSGENLYKIHSIEFLNSVCFIRKAVKEECYLGKRLISGSQEAVVAGHEKLNGSKNSLPEQANNKWSSPDMALTELHAKGNQLRKAVFDLQAEANALRQSIQAEQAEKNTMRQTLRAEQVEKESAKHEVNALRKSRSWRYTSILRAAGLLTRSSISLISRAKEIAIQDISYTDFRKSISVGEGNPSCPTVGACDFANAPSASFDVLSGLVEPAAPAVLKEDLATLIAFYLPQYHRVPENSEWWGPGFTEWTNVVKGEPNYEGHYQPHLPRELGFYDLSYIEVMREQSEMAKLYGVGAFCFYYYWFSGRRILDRPIDNFLNSDIDMPYCLCWANENWTRTWDGDTQSVLLEQKYLESDPQSFIDSLLPHFRDRRYIQVEGKPMLVVYRAKDIPNTNRVFSLWRETLKAAGFPGLHIAVVDFYDIARPDEVGADALVEFPPHKFNGPQSILDRMPKITNRDFRGGIADYAKVMAQSANRPTPDFTLYRGVVPSWDNTARRQNTPTILHGSSPDLFEEWLRYVRAYSREALGNRSDHFIFVNAWNEWGEGCHLEPDQKYGLRYLEAVKASSWYDVSSADAIRARSTLFAAAAASVERRDRLTVGQCDKSTIKQALAVTRSAENAVQKIAFLLRRYPVAHWVGKRAYKFYLAINSR